MSTGLGKKSKNALTLLNGILLILVVAGCSPSVKQKVLKTLFDGVPDETGAVATKRGQRVEESLKTAQKEADQEKRMTLVKQAEPPKEFKHYPYEERECDACHVGQTSQALKEPVPDLCFGCHDNFLESLKSKHYPAQEGMCLECHHPHHAPYPKLLIAEGQALCLNCHDMDDLKKVDPHGEIGEESCTDCHGPHGD